MRLISKKFKGCRDLSPAPFVYLLAAVFASIPFISAYAGEIRGLWVIRTEITTAEKIDGLIKYAVANGYNNLFVQVRGRGDAYYKSAFVPGPDDIPGIPGKFDPLGHILKKTDGTGIKIHAWMNMNLNWSGTASPKDPRHPAVCHTDWFVVSLDGLDHGTAESRQIAPTEAEGRFLSPAKKEVRKYLSDVVSEVLDNYQVDGIHLDYIRYPGSGYDFGKLMVDGYRSKWGKNIFEVVSGDMNQDPNLDMYSKWIEYRTEQVDSIVCDIRAIIRAKNPAVELSAAVKPEPDEAFFKFGQNWTGWVNKGLVDFVVPMSYYLEKNVFEFILDLSLRRVDKEKVVPGIGIYRLAPDKAMEQVEIAKTRGTAGFCLFSYQSLLTDEKYIDFNIP
jgi:uncharacterized lipoprotein YddW (UPF0748 family)